MPETPLHKRRITARAIRVRGVTCGRGGFCRGANGCRRRNLGPVFEERGERKMAVISGEGAKTRSF